MSNNGIIIRPGIDSDVAGIAKVNVDTWRSAYRWLLPETFLDGLSYTKQEERLRRYMSQPGSIYHVAETLEGLIAGYVGGGPERTGDRDFTAEIYALYVLEQYQGRGLGSGLVGAWADEMCRGGAMSALVWALTANRPAGRFYQRLGARPIREQSIQIGGENVAETAFAWADLASIKTR